MKSIRYFLIILFSATLFSCYEDKGNYDYTPISDITIEGIEESYTVISGVDHLQITPQITTEFPENELEYIWELWTSKGRDTISRERDLNYPVTLASNDYTLYYFVIHKGGESMKETGYFMNTYCTINVKTEYSEGFYILKETATGNTELDLLLMDDRSRHDLLTAVHNGPLPGKPRNLSILFGRQMIDPDVDRISYSNCLGIITYGGAVNILRGKDLYLAFDHSSLFFEDPGNDVPVKFNSGYTSEYYSSKGTYYLSILSRGSGVLSYPQSNYPTTSDLGGHLRKSLSWFYWDEANKNMMYTPESGISKIFNNSNAQAPTTGLNNYECMYISGGRTEVYYIFRDQTDQSIVIYEVTAAYIGGEPYVTNVYHMNPGHILEQAVHFSSYERGEPRYLYFVVNNKLHYLDLKTVDPNLWKPTFTSREYALNLPAGEEISYLSHQHFTMTGISPIFNYLTIATQKSGEYHIYMYDISTGGLPLGGASRSLSGTGTVKSVNFMTTADYMPINMMMTSSLDNYFWNR